MKTMLLIICATAILGACTNAGRSDDNVTDSLNAANDSLNRMDNTDPNNRNTIGYDSTAKSRDTASYERMNQVQGDSTRR